MIRIDLERLESPIGAVVLGVADGAVCALEFADDEAPVRARLARTHPGARFGPGARRLDAVARVNAYFAGDLGALDEMPVAAAGTTFQRRVWRALREIPVGRTRSYAELARAIGRPRAVRAVGAANGQNPIALVVPCHRVIASDGSLHGYGGGLPRKAWLLRHEGAILA